MGKRLYEEPWEVLKTTGAVSMRITATEGALDTEIVDRYAKTYRKAMQKEKYLDGNYRAAYPNSKMESVIDYPSNTVRFTLHNNDLNRVSTEMFNVKCSSTTSQTTGDEGSETTS